jgi:hypothetical protein
VLEKNFVRKKKNLCGKKKICALEKNFQHAVQTFASFAAL